MTIREKKHLKYVRSHPCLIHMDGLHCNQTPVVAHHLTFIKGGRGIGQKVGDDKTVPLCWNHHVELHQRGEKSFWKNYGFELERVLEIAKELGKGYAFFEEA